jgi:hypothetical protein
MNTSATSLKALTTLRTKKAIALLAFCRRKDGHGIGHGATLWSFLPKTIQKRLIYPTIQTKHILIV